MFLLVLLKNNIFQRWISSVSISGINNNLLKIFLSLYSLCSLKLFLILFGYFDLLFSVLETFFRYLVTFGGLWKKEVFSTGLGAVWNLGIHHWFRSSMGFSVSILKSRCFLHFKTVLVWGLIFIPPWDPWFDSFSLLVSRGSLQYKSEGLFSFLTTSSGLSFPESVESVTTHSSAFQLRSFVAIFFSLIIFVLSGFGKQQDKAKWKIAPQTFYFCVEVFREGNKVNRWTFFIVPCVPL